MQHAVIASVGTSGEGTKENIGPVTSSNISSLSHASASASAADRGRTSLSSSNFTSSEETTNPTCQEVQMSSAGSRSGKGAEEETIEFDD